MLKIEKGDNNNERSKRISNGIKRATLFND